jgi:hypothetical protein
MVSLSERKLPQGEPHASERRYTDIPASPLAQQTRA